MSSPPLSNLQQPKKGVLDLPDINLSEPQTYETPDTPDPSINNNEPINEIENADIDRPALQTSKAFQKFNNRKFNNKNEDFSESIAKKRSAEPRTGGLLKNQTVFDILPSSEGARDETALQRFQRLQFEVSSFMEEMNVIGEQNGEVEKDIKATELTQQLAELQNQLSTLLSNDKLSGILDKSKPILHHSQIQNTNTHKLISEINSFTNSPNESTANTTTTTTTTPTSTTTNSTSPSNHVTYELYYTAEQSKYQQPQRIVDLEKRLSRLESLTGSKSDSIPITQSLLEIREKLSLLDPTKVDIIQQKMKSYLKDMEQFKIQEENNGSTQKTLTTNEKKINDIFENIHKWDETSQQLPGIINRLYTLRSLHQEGINFSAQVSALEKQQFEITSLLKNDSQIMNKMDESFSANLQIIKSNVESLEKRIEELNQKILSKKQDQ